MVDAVAVNVPAIGAIPAGTLVDVVANLDGRVDYAASAAGSAEYKANAAQAKADQVEGQAQYAADTAGSVKGTMDKYVAPLVGKMDSEMNQVFAALGLTRA